MRKFALVSVLTLSVGLSGCASFQPNDLTAVYTQIQAYVVQTCKFEPTITSIASVIASFFPGGAIVSGGAKTVGDAICAGLGSSASAFASAGSASGKNMTAFVKTPRGTVAIVGRIKK